MKTKFMLVLATLVCTAVHAQELSRVTSFNIAPETRQLILVTTQDWNKTTGKLQRYEADNGGWKKVGEVIAVAIGKSGLAWGDGLHENKGNPTKKEGDGKAPAGVFSLGTMFGYPSTLPFQTTYPYRQSTARDYFVDDVKSPDYNTWVNIPPEKPNTPGERWASFEKMKRTDAIYEYGIVINHNTTPTIAGNGSAIFFHIWRSPTSPTLGCTSMSKENLLTLMQWLDKNKNPLVIQAPESELSGLR